MLKIWIALLRTSCRVYEFVLIQGYLSKGNKFYEVDERINNTKLRERDWEVRLVSHLGIITSKFT